MTEDRDRRDREEREQETVPKPYVPPEAEDIDTRHEPAETIAGAGRTLGAEESDRWH